MKYLISLLAGLCLLPGLAAAHVFALDQGVGVVMHIEPDDQPTAGKPATIVMEFTDRARAITPDCPESCGLSLQISKDGVSIADHPVTIRESVAGQPMIFPEAGTYLLRLGNARFQTSFAYYVRGMAAAEPTPLRRALPLVTIFAAALVLIFLLHPLNLTRS